MNVVFFFLKHTELDPEDLVHQRQCFFSSAWSWFGKDVLLSRTDAQALAHTGLQAPNHWCCRDASVMHALNTVLSIHKSTLEGPQLRGFLAILMHLIF